MDAEEFTIIMNEIETIKSRLRHLELAKHTPDPRDNEGAPDALVPRGKYRGKDRDWVVATDPHHVGWLVANGLAAGLGYTEEHISKALELAKKMPATRR